MAGFITEHFQWQLKTSGVLATENPVFLESDQDALPHFTLFTGVWTKLIDAASALHR